MAMAAHSGTGLLGFTHTLSEKLSSLRTRFTQYRAFRKTFAELQCLSNRELADIGLNRSMIFRIASEAIYDS